MENQFQVTKYRCSAADTDKIVVQGWISYDFMEGHEIVFSCGSSRLKATMTKREGLEIKRKYILYPYDISTEFYFWVSLPKDLKKKKYIRVFDVFEGKSRLVFVIPVSRILKMQKKIDKFIEEPIYNGEEVVIRGWYVSNETVDVAVKDAKGNTLPCTMKNVYRKDVVLEYPEVTMSEVKGFELTFPELKEKKVVITLKASQNIRNIPAW